MIQKLKEMFNKQQPVKNLAAPAMEIAIAGYNEQIPYVASVEEIHNEFDTAPDRLYESAEKLLASLAIPTASKIEEEAKMLAQLGFTSVPKVEQFKEFEANQKKIIDVRNKTEEEARLIMYYKTKYPFQKFLTIAELNRICEKYSLTYDSVSQYIKEVPKKNLLEIANAPQVNKDDRVKVSKITQVNISGDFADNKERELAKSSKLKEFLRNKICIHNSPDISSEKQAYIIMRRSLYNPLSRIEEEKELQINTSQEVMSKFGVHISPGDFIIDTQNINLFIAAPISHFKEAQIDINIVEPLDPIVFRYVNGGVQILSKWGTEDDQSHKDEALTNEILN